jgi:hypothetical protein
MQRQARAKIIVGWLMKYLNALDGLGIDVPIHELLIIEIIMSKKKLADRQDWEVKNAGARFHSSKNCWNF